jgi:hypothetical protein
MASLPVLSREVFRILVRLCYRMSQQDPEDVTHREPHIPRARVCDGDHFGNVCLKKIMLSCSVNGFAKQADSYG